MGNGGGRGKQIAQIKRDCGWKRGCKFAPTRMKSFLQSYSICLLWRNDFILGKRIFERRASQVVATDWAARLGGHIPWGVGGEGHRRSRVGLQNCQSMRRTRRCPVKNKGLRLQNPISQLIRLAAIFIECSYDDSQTNDRLSDHLCSRFIIDELRALVSEDEHARIRI